jgi:hypothetical protein
VNVKTNNVEGNSRKRSGKRTLSPELKRTKREKNSRPSKELLESSKLMRKLKKPDRGKALKMKWEPLLQKMRLPPKQHLQKLKLLLSKWKKSNKLKKPLSLKKERERKRESLKNKLPLLRKYMRLLTKTMKFL